MPNTLARLIQRAADTSKPYNCQDAILIIKSLSALRVTRPEVRAICEKACFSIASSPHEVEAPVVVDVVNHLSTLQSSHLPVVQKILVKRFCELPLRRESRGAYTSCPVDPRTAQKAALALCKLGRCPSSEAAVEHVLRLLHVLLSLHQQDTGLHIAYIALYTYSSRFASQPRWWRTPQPATYKPAVVTLAKALCHVLNHADVYVHAKGNVAWQLLHVLLVLPPASYAEQAGLRVSRQSLNHFEAYCRSGALARATSCGAYAAFLQTFSADVWCSDPTRSIWLVNGVFKSGEDLDLREGTTPTASVLRRCNVYDATKLANAVAQLLSKRVVPVRMLSSSSSHLLTSSEGVSEDEELDSATLNAETSQDVFDAEEAEREKLLKCRFALDCLVLWEQKQLLASSTARPTTDAFSEEQAAPDSLLVASLLHAYAKIGFDHNTTHAPGSHQSLRTLLAFLPQLSNTTPALLSWMLASLAGIANSDAVEWRDAAGLSNSATYLLRQYVRSAPRQRCMRSDTETLYGYVRVATTASAGRTTKNSLYAGDESVEHFRSSDKLSSKNEGEINDFKLRSAPQQEEKGKILFGNEDALLQPSFSFRNLGVLLRDTAQRLRSAATGGAAAPQQQDVDMLLLVLLDVYSVAGNAQGGGGVDAADAQPFSEGLASLQSAVIEFLENEVLREEGDSTGLCLRALRLSVLNGAITSFGVADSDIAARLNVLELQHLQRLQLSSTVVVDSAMMLRCFAQLQCDRYAAAVPANALLRVLCDKYEKHLQSCVSGLAESSERTREDVTRVLRRARQVGVQVELQGDVVQGGESTETKSSAKPLLVVPHHFWDLDKLTMRAAANLLKLLSEAKMANAEPANNDDSSVAHQIAAHLMQELQRIPNAEGMQRLLEVTASPTFCRVLFPNSSDMAAFFASTKVNALHMLCGLKENASPHELPSQRIRRASRFLAAVAQSQPFFQVARSSWKKDDELQRVVLQIAEHVEPHAKKHDEISLLKIKLLCGGVL